MFKLHNNMSDIMGQTGGNWILVVLPQGSEYPDDKDDETID